MKKLYESGSQELLYVMDQNMIISRWKAQTKDLTNDQYLFEVHKLFTYFRKYEPQKMLCDITYFDYKLDPESPAFIANLFKDYRADYTALVARHGNISNEVVQMIEEVDKLTLGKHTCIFSSEDAAKRWLLAFP